MPSGTLALEENPVPHAAPTQLWNQRSPEDIAEDIEAQKTSSYFAVVPSSVSVYASPCTASHCSYALSKEKSNLQRRIQKLMQSKKIRKEEDTTTLHKRLMRGNSMRWKAYRRLTERKLRLYQTQQQF